MTISESIINDISIQPITQTISELKNMFNLLTYSHIPIAKDGQYIGCIAEYDLRCFDDDKSIASYSNTLSPFYVRKSFPLLDILKAFVNNGTNLMPVLDDQTNTYLGYFELHDAMAILDNTPFFSEEGNFIVIEKGEHDFSFSQISQIIESNEGRLYGAYISEMRNGVTQITLKINNTRLNEILQTFRRYDYKIISEHQEDSYLRDLKERSDYLNKYLNI